MIKKFLLTLFLISNIFLIQSQAIEIQGNGEVIVADGFNEPNTLDGTYYDETPILGLRSHTFSIKNLDLENDVNIKISKLNSLDFKLVGKIRKLKKGETKEFEIEFEPTSAGVKTDVVRIESGTKKEKLISTFNIEGLAVEETEGGSAMISQYYENGDNDHIEIKNLTEAGIKNKAFVLALYKTGDDLNKAPKKGNTIEIGEMSPGEVMLFSKFKLNGNDVIILSTSKGKNCYKDRVDIIGLQGSNWGQGVSFSKGGCASEQAHINFDPNNWIALETSKVDQAASVQNIALGTYQTGPIYWDNGSWTDSALPDLTRITYIESTYDGTIGNIEACDLIINAAVDFDKGGKNSLVVYRDLAVNASLTIGDQESLVMYDDNATITGDITKIENSTHRNNQYDFTYWSSPIMDGQIGTVFSGVNPGRIYTYDQSKTSTSDPSEPGYWDRWVNTSSGNLIPGKGYAAEGVSGTTGVHSIQFNGQPNNGVIYEKLHFWPDADLDNDFNLIGNPYPSAIDIETFFDANNSVLDPVVYLWTHTTALSGGDFSPNDYATYNYTGGTGTGEGQGVGDGPIPKKNIGSAQGFFVRSIASGDAVFTNSMRMEDANDQFFKQNVKKSKNKKQEKDRIWLNLTTDQGGFNQLLLGFIEGGSDGFDQGYDAIKLEGSNILSFYSLLDDKKLAIQGLGVNPEPNDVSLGFDSKVGNRTLSISIGKLEGTLKDLDIFLIDHQLLYTHDLKGSAYVFDLDVEGSYKNRFSLSFKQQAVLSAEEIIQKDALIIVNKNDLFSVNASENVKTIKLYNILGKLIVEEHPNESSFDFKEYQAQKGSILLMEVLLEGNTRIQKKIIKN